MKQTPDNLSHTSGSAGKQPLWVAGHVTLI